MPGTGKSSALVELASLGYRVIDTDDQGWREYHPYPEPIDDLHRGEWHWVHEKMNELLASDGDPSLFVGGSGRNQANFYDRFDAVVLLSAPAEVLLERIAERTTNDYGKTERDRAEVLADIVEIEPRLRAQCTHELDSNQPLDEVVARLVAIESELSAKT
jgi:broad-specificity NMP kinase